MYEMVIKKVLNLHKSISCSNGKNLFYFDK